ncbi:hypothetical protein JCM19275_1374 [Nonlabens ulvanivorans]|uniref:CBM-cenC domain-containing protein n=1 Tax=Nonlabens ulvanivorans TaxID=906888 RepID=A0A090WHZ8_NONUL|nr:hypothetical protein [Nonlabens ulvanivorans]GAL76700.1 hypothetical protein JCM19275_1374 [Nonlabens ulvanivorans]
MKRNILVHILLLMSFLSAAQVGINTDTPDDGSALQIESTTGGLAPPRMNTSQMLSIPTPLEGSIIFNNGSWESKKNNSSVVLNRNFAGSETIPSNGTFNNLPIGASTSEIVETDTADFTINGDSSITILKSGIYQISGGISIRSMTAGTHKYILAAFINGSRSGYLSRGYTTLPSSDYWGTSGTVTLKLNANQTITVEFWLNSGSTENLDFCNISIVKLN